MSEERYEIDYDAEAVFFENGWRGRQDLARLIRSMIDKGDYRVARPSAVLEKLEAALAGARVLAVRVPPDLAEAVEARAAREGRTVSSVLRVALGGFLGLASNTGGITIPSFEARGQRADDVSAARDGAKGHAPIAPRASATAAATASGSAGAMGANTVLPRANPVAATKDLKATPSLIPLAPTERPQLAQVAERLAEAVLAETDSAESEDPTIRDSWFGG